MLAMDSQSEQYIVSKACCFMATQNYDLGFTILKISTQLHFKILENYFLTLQLKAIFYMTSEEKAN